MEWRQNSMRRWYKKAKQYWGSKASGCLFVCIEDSSVLLFLRSEDVEQGGTWGITGGAIPKNFNQSEEIDEGFIDSAETPFEESAHRETQEEAGSMPAEYDLLDVQTYQDNNFVYQTYIYNIPLEIKQEWTPNISLNWENKDYKWFNINNLPDNLHFGVKYILPALKNLI